MSTRTAPLRINPGRFVVFATLAFAVCFYGIPLLWLFIAGTRSESSLLTQSPFALGDWDSFVRTWNNLTTYNNFQILTWTVNSLIYVVGGVLLSLIACIPAGYALAASEFPGRRLVLILTLIAMITPSTAVVLPIFLELNMLGLSNTYAGLILASGFFPFGVYLTYVYFSTSLPKGVMDSARVDGANRFQLFSRIALPLARPIIALVAFFSFLGIWSNYFLAFVLLSDDKLYNLPVGLTALVSGSGALSNLPSNDVPIKKPEVVLAAILVVLPVLLIFMAAQRFVRSGTLSGAEKG
ncbi:MAG TPA: carbohydrate ABC transporter permease [Devosia sp.]|jgi:multiple sugar transport system permease protein|uniref:carbohydrate ABC transporter permease n=1 Tax=Devosia sp. TaxID=1871048 RepID=UPI002DDCD009|nr:carbohydrate ABC transporter permease [Devosia sp.]HEV2515865.1 carbohydrate ABC transporter permease [Devosia sp.]